MSFATLERAILQGSRISFNNPKLRMKDIQEWSSGKIEAPDGEVSIYIDDPGVYVSIKIEHDKRK